MQKKSEALLNLIIDFQKKVSKGGKRKATGWDKADKKNYIESEINDNKVKHIQYRHSIAAFSDHIVISNSNKEDPYKAVQVVLSICYEIGELFRMAFDKGFILRGAVTQGKLYHQANVICGNALVEAYKIEESISVYPRVILSKNVAELLPDVSSRTHKELIKDKDGFYFVNWMPGLGRYDKTTLLDVGYQYANGYSSTGPEIEVEVINKEIALEYKTKIEFNLQKHCDNSHIIEKWRWFANYYNQIVKQYGTIEEQEKLLITVKKTAGS